MANPNEKHHVVVRLSYEIHEMTKTGECQGSPIEVGKIRHGIDGINLDDAKKRANELIERVKQCR